MASESTVVVMNEQQQQQQTFQKDNSSTIEDSSTHPKPMDIDTTKADESSDQNSCVTKVTASDTSDTNGNVDINGTVIVALRAAKSEVKCVGRSNKGLSWGYGMEQGRRSTMEDVAVVHPGFLEVCCKDVGGCTAPECKYAMEKSPVHFFGIFDGHGGDQVSSYCANELCKILAEEWERGSTLEGWSKRWEVALCNAYERADDVFKDEALAAKSVGSTALVLAISACQIIAANCGDSRAVLCRGAQAIPLTVDHKLDRADELERITSNGGRILNWGCLRVEGVLSMSRAIGDHDLKPWVISVPEVTFMTRTEQDEFLILASDGLWDVLSNEEVVKFARKELRQQRRLVGLNDSPYPPAWYVSQHVIRQALDAGSYDNISVIIVDLKIPRIRCQKKL